jgi:hypothetical protein
MAVGFLRRGRRRLAVGRVVGVGSVHPMAPVNKKTDTIWLDVEIIARSKFDNGWRVIGDDTTAAWVDDDRIIDSEDDLRIGVRTKIELTISYAEYLGLA